MSHEPGNEASTTPDIAVRASIILLQVVSLVSELCNQDATKMLHTHTLCGIGGTRMGMRLDEPGN